MYKIIVLSLACLSSLQAMEEQPAKKNNDNQAQVISFVQALMSKTYTFNGSSSSDLFYYPDYRGGFSYEVPFNTLGKTIDEILNLPGPQGSNLHKELHAIGERHPYNCDEAKSEYLAAYHNICESDLYHLGIYTFKQFHEQGDLKSFSQKDRTRNLSQLKENRRLFFASLTAADVKKFNECHQLEYSKKPIPSLLSHVKKAILLTQKKGQPIIDSPVNSDDDNLPEFSEAQKNDVTEIIARLQKINTGN